MPKNIEDMIVPERTRSIRDIPIPEGRKKSDRGLVLPQRREYNTSKTYRKGRWWGIGVALVLIIFAVLSFFNGATLAYVPRSQKVSFDKNVLTAQKSGEGELLYSVVKLSRNKGLEVKASGEEATSTKASGIIIVYNNNASGEVQRLTENTRFETPSGLVYRIPRAIVIPGRKTVSGVTTPGSIETIAYADEPGDKYNIGLSDFTVPGLAGTSRYTTIYGRSKTEMSGGFTGIEKKVSPQELSQGKAGLERALKEELLSEVKSEVPEDFVLLPALSAVTFKDLAQTESLNKDTAMINMRGDLYGVMFKQSDLATRLALAAPEKVALTPLDKIDLIGLESLDFAFVNPAPMDLLAADKISFSVSGNAVVVWRTDEVALTRDLVGKHKRDIPTILNNYPNVTSATVTIRPFWKSSFPADSSRISITALPVQ
jgi:hypothetical protein